MWQLVDLIRRLLPSPEKPARPDGLNTKGQTREEYLPELEDDPLFKEMTGEELWALIVGAADPSEPKTQHRE